MKTTPNNDEQIMLAAFNEAAESEITTVMIGEFPIPKSRLEIQVLKSTWAEDPHWDIEDTEGFEAHREELLAFHEEQAMLWEEESRKRKRANKKAYRAFVKSISCEDNEPLADLILELAGKIESLETRVEDLEYPNH
jgi:hypothetical protein